MRKKKRWMEILSHYICPSAYAEYASPIEQLEMLSFSLIYLLRPLIVTRNSMWIGSINIYS